jgi:hypothetical protein
VPAILPGLWTALVFHIMLTEENNGELHIVGTGQWDIGYVAQIFMINFGMPYVFLLTVTSAFYWLSKTAGRKEQE